MDGINIEKAIAGLKDGTLIATPSDYLQKLQEEIGELRGYLEHIKDILSAAIARPEEIAIDWKEFLLKFVNQALKKGRK